MKSYFKARFREINDINLFIIDYSIFGTTTVSPMRDHRVLSKLVTKREKQMSILISSPFRQQMALVSLPFQF